MKRPKPISLQPFARAACMLTMSCSIALAQDANNREPDPRFKADILVVVAHPDDETMVTAYLAREIHDHHRSVAVVVATRGDGGNNAVGPEQAAAMGDIREMEGRRALASLGISNVWFLGGPDTPSQNVLQSLESWDHGRCLGRLVRIVRLTRPSVILSFVPAFLSGENHGDHQAAGVLATEAFDLAGDPIAFPEQVSPARDPNATGNLTEALHTWQPQKIYYFANPYENVFTSKGPEYSSTEMSASQHTTYAELAAQAFTFHMTQGGATCNGRLAIRGWMHCRSPCRLLTPFAYSSANPSFHPVSRMTCSRALSLTVYHSGGHQASQKALLLNQACRSAIPGTSMIDFGKRMGWRPSRTWRLARSRSCRTVSCMFR